MYRKLLQKSVRGMSQSVRASKQKGSYIVQRKRPGVYDPSRSARLVGYRRANEEPAGNGESHKQANCTAVRTRLGDSIKGPAKAGYCPILLVNEVETITVEAEHHPCDDAS
jgi:hypothetical protein